MELKQAIKILNLYRKINDKCAIPLTKEELKFKLEEDFTQKVSEAINLLLEDNTRLDKENQKLFEENLFKDQIIDEMAKHFYDLDVAARISHTPTIYNFKSVKHAKEWFYEKVEKQE